MKTNCEPFLPELAAFASDAAELSPGAAAHVANCVQCRKKIAELKGITAMHREAAANLVEPKLRLGRDQLEGALTGGGSDLEIQWRPVLAGVLTLALIVAAALMYRSSRDTADAKPQAKQVLRETKSADETLEPTLLTLRHEVESGREPMLAGTIGGRMRHYRVKDVGREP